MQIELFKDIIQDDLPKNPLLSPCPSITAYVISPRLETRNRLRCVALYRATPHCDAFGVVGWNSIAVYVSVCVCECVCGRKRGGTYNELMRKSPRNAVSFSCFSCVLCISFSFFSEK